MSLLSETVMENTSPQAIITGWTTLAAETINGVNNVLWEYTPTGQLSYWNTDESWNWTSNFGEYSDGSADYYTAETQFGVDVNQDGIIGEPAPEPEPEPEFTRTHTLLSQKDPLH